MENILIFTLADIFNPKKYIHSIYSKFIAKLTSHVCLSVCCNTNWLEGTGSTQFNLIVRFWLSLFYCELSLIVLFCINNRL